MDRNLFRDVNKMCHVFKVDWLSRRCGEYFEGLVGEIRPSTDYQTLLFLFEEARYILKVVESKNMLDMVVQKICGMQKIGEIFVEPYMKNYRELGNDQLDLMLHMMKNNPVTVLKIIKKNMKVEGMTFDDKSRHLLEKIDLFKCISDDEPFFEDFFDFLEGVSFSSVSDTLLVNRLYRSVTKEFKKRRKTGDEALAVTKTQLPNVFCSFESHYGLSRLEYFEKMRNSPLVQNIYMFIEGLLPVFYKIGFSPEIVHEIEVTRRQRSWSRISPEFFTSCHSVFETALVPMLENSCDLVSDEENFRRVGKIVGTKHGIPKVKSCKIEDLFLSPMSFAFHFKHPTTENCDLPGKCGFLLKFQPETKLGQPYKFNVNLCLDQKEYPDGLHFHKGLVKADKIHLVPMLQNFGLGEMKYNHATFTGNGCGVSKIFVDEDSLT